MTSLKDILDIINNIESRFPVSGWQIDGIDIWPLIRIDLNFQLSFLLLNVSNNKGNSGNIRKVLKGPFKYLSGSFKDAKKNDKIRKADFLFLSDGISFVKLKDEYYERFCDPIIERLSNKGYSSLRLDCYHIYYTPRAHKSIFIQPFLDITIIRELFFGNKVNYESLTEFDACGKYFDELKLGINFPSKNSIEKTFKIVKASSDFFSKKLISISPKAVFIPWYYGKFEMGLIQACSKLGIPTIDIQHGVQGELHAAYGRWVNVPENGYNLLPTHFLCWSESDVKVISSWSNKINNHKALMGGNFFLEQWKDNTNKWTIYYDKIFNSSFDINRRKILVTLSPGLSDANSMDSVFQTISETQKDYIWLIRLHPNMLSEKESIRDLLLNYNITEFEIHLSSELPLYSILRNIQLHITHSSSALKEADNFGIDTIITSEYGAELYENEIRQQTATFASSPKEIITVIREKLEKTNRRQLIVNERPIEKILKEIL